MLNCNEFFTPVRWSFSFSFVAFFPIKYENISTLKWKWVKNSSVSGGSGLEILSLKIGRIGGRAIESSGWRSSSMRRACTSLVIICMYLKFMDSSWVWSRLTQSIQAVISVCMDVCIMPFSNYLIRIIFGDKLLRTPKLRLKHWADTWYIIMSTVNEFPKSFNLFTRLLHFELDSIIFLGFRMLHRWINPWT